MNRETHQGRVGQSSAPAAAKSPAAGKQTLAQRGAEPPGWSQLLDSVGVTANAANAASAANETSAAQPQEQSSATSLPIQRQEIAATPDVEATEASIDPQALRAELQRLGGDADDLVMGIELQRASAAFSFADEDAFHQTRLREVTSAVEALRPDVQASGDAGLLALLAAVQDRLVAGYQALAITHADESLQAWSGSDDEAQQLAQRQRWGLESGDSTGDWCGIFANAQFRASGMNQAFAAAFNHTSNVAQFFSYVHSRRTPTNIVVAGSPEGAEPIDLRTYHEQRGSLRSWKTGADIGDDLRPGDILTVDWGGDADADANHTCIVSSYTPASGDQGATVVTIDGNAFGVRKPDAALPAFDGADMTTLRSEEGTAGNNYRDLSISAWQVPVPEAGATQDAAESAEAVAPTYGRVGSDQGQQQLTIVGRGRPSVVDFESDHQYPGALEIADLTTELTSPLQRSETGPATANDPSRAFATAASGSFSEIPYRAEMEARFAADFSSVQSFAGRGLDDLGALAATRGEQVVFSSGTPDRQTVAHELTHVLQSRQGLVTDKAMSDPGDASEHEARSVAASIEAPAGQALASQASAQAQAKTSMNASAPPQLAAAPSGAIHRQDSAAPHPPHLDNTEGQARPIDWDAGRATMLENPAELAGAASAREVYDFYLLRNLGVELPAMVADYLAQSAGAELPAETLTADEGRAPRAAAVAALLAFVDARMATLVAEGAAGRAQAEAIRVPLFRASQQAVVSTLNVENSRRYRQTRADDGTITQTFCNVFAYDMVTAMGAYLPRVWWRDPAAAQANPTLDPDLVNTMQMNANALYQWMLDWGPAFGWRGVATPELAQTEANGGKIVVILGGLGDVGITNPGHISVVMAESAAQGLAQREEGLPMQAQAGAVNYSNSGLSDGAQEEGLGPTATGPWWLEFEEEPLQERAERADMSVWPQYARGHGFFVYDGAARGEVSIRTPEEMGLVLPAAAEPAAPAEAPVATAS